MSLHVYELDCALTSKKIKINLLLYRILVSHLAFPFVIDYDTQGFEKEIQEADLGLLEDIDQIYQKAENQIHFTYQEYLETLSDDARADIENQYEMLLDSYWNL